MSHAPANDGYDPESLSRQGLKQSRMITKVLTPAVRLWLRSLLEQVEDLQINIQAGDRLLLTGHIPKVSLSARRAVYQGLHLRQIQLVAETIRINLGQVLKGKPLRLLEPVPVTGELLVEEVDLNASLQGTLLPNGLTEFSIALLKAGGCQNPTELLQNRQITWDKIAIDSGEIKLSGTVTDSGKQNAISRIAIHTGVELASCHELRFICPQIEVDLDLNFPSLDTFQLDLGPEVDLQELTLSPGQLFCRGGILVRTD